MRVIAIAAFSVVILCAAHSATQAQQSADCKLCREDHRACTQAHSQAACRTNYDICMKRCQKR
jgi:hypothetical protein